MKLHDRIISILKGFPTDQYSIYLKLGRNSMSEITKVLTDLQQKKIIFVANYRKNDRTGLDIPVYSLRPVRQERLDVHSLLAGVTSERLVEYDFVARNLPSPHKSAAILEVGSGDSLLVQSMREFGSRWHVFGIDLKGGDAIMDARSAGFRDGTFDQIISISTMEHVGLGSGINDKSGDIKAVQEISRMLKKEGSAIITVPYGRKKNEGHRVYDRAFLARLTGRLSVAKREFFHYSAGKWENCSQADAGRADSPVPFRNAACACLLLKKQ